MATKPELNIAKNGEDVDATKYNENFDRLNDYIEEISEELLLKVNTINSQLSSSILSNLQSVYPVGSLYIGITDTCPIASLFGTWEKVAEGLCLQGATGSQVVGETVEAGLPNITGRFGVVGSSSAVGWNSGVTNTGAFYRVDGIGDHGTASASGTGGFGFDASRSSSVYGKSNTVQPPAYLVNVWKRTA